MTWPRIKQLKNVRRTFIVVCYSTPQYGTAQIRLDMVATYQLTAGSTARVLEQISATTISRQRNFYFLSPREFAKLFINSGFVEFLRSVTISERHRKFPK